MKKFKIKKGDTVMVIAGDHKGDKGVIKHMLTKEDKVIVDGLNMVKRHTKPSSVNPQGGIIEKEAPIHISNVMLVDKKTHAPTRVGRKLDPAINKLVRVSKKTGDVI